MPGKTVPILTYIVYSLFSAGIYGLAAFFVIYRGLAGGVMLYAYLWNIGFITIGLVLDKITNDVLLSKGLVITKRNYFFVMLAHMLSFISFKTTLYFFYTFVLIVSRVSILAPNLVSDDFRNFVLSIEYCLILVVVADKFIEHLKSDDQKIRRISAKFEKFAKFVTTKRNRKSIPAENPASTIHEGK